MDLPFPSQDVIQIPLCLLCPAVDGYPYVWEAKSMTMMIFHTVCVFSPVNGTSPTCLMTYMTSHALRAFVSSMMTAPNGNIYRVTGPLCGEFSGHRWIPLTKNSDAELWYFRRAHYDVTVMDDKVTNQMWSLWWLLVTSRHCHWYLCDAFLLGMATDSFPYKTIILYLEKPSEPVTFVSKCPPYTLSLPCPSYSKFSQLSYEPGCSRELWCRKCATWLWNTYVLIFSKTLFYTYIQRHTAAAGTKYYKTM